MNIYEINKKIYYSVIVFDTIDFDDFYHAYKVDLINTKNILVQQ